MLRLLTFYLLLGSALGYDGRHSGAMYISKLDGKTVYKRLKVYGARLYVDNEFSTFELSSQGTLEFSEGGLYLSVNDIGRVFLNTEPHVGFSVKPDSHFGRVLMYGGVSDFQLCEDGSIAFKSRCKGARTIVIKYKDIGEAI